MRKRPPLVMRCDLAPGDWLYVPSGFWHVARAEADSLSVSIGVAAPTAMDLFDALRTHFAESAVWRQRLSPIGPQPDFAATLSQESARILGDSRLLERAIDEVRRKHARRAGPATPDATDSIVRRERECEATSLPDSGPTRGGPSCARGPMSPRATQRRDLCSPWDRRTGPSVGAEHGFSPAGWLSGHERTRDPGASIGQLDGADLSRRLEV